MNFKNLPESEKPREKALKYGIESLNNAELLSIILRTGEKNNSVLDLSYKLLEDFGGLEGLKNLSYQQISIQKGIKQAKAISILACIEIAKRINYQKNEKIKIDHIAKVFEILEPLYSDEEQEKLVVLFLNNKLFLIMKKEIFIGGLDHHLVHPRDIFREALKLNSNKIFLIHNHPSGDSTPSKEDIETTEELVKLGSRLGIEILDHIILGKGEYYSIKKETKY